jgi:hypothetical protein
VNLYTNPQEDVSIGIRHSPMAVPVGGAVTSYLVDLARYPPRFKVFFASNNPPLYDLVPQLKELMRPGAGGNGGPGTAPGVPGMPTGVQGATGKR